MQIFSDQNLERIRVAHSRVRAKTTTAIAEAMVEAGEHAVDHVKRYPTFKPRTGKLQDSTEWRTVKVAGGRILRIRNTAKHAAFVEYGTRSHVIRARRGKALRFTVRGKLVFARKVNHPGTRPYKFLYRATNSAGRVLQQKLAAKLGVIAKQF